MPYDSIIDSIATKLQGGARSALGFRVVLQRSGYEQAPPRATSSPWSPLIDVSPSIFDKLPSID